ncbi:MAG: energy-coupling factor transport system ATP-binding protein [Thermococcaceae archaeon]|jgi:energy-coupling factor transport system ATP-binding protein|uniref:Cobalt ABC transporter ATPase n=1 Tax=Thermococcus sibiricus TaxID=172049 RepID=A0A101EKH6_9EURY|nr:MULTISPECIES: ABC transporter ATP-binding protein [Thermococcus]MDK2783600.1 energy-coupling factor transport system ATP-binding protein [Thermococcaceae archaeon]KUK16847.1 MAG: Cobalt ABC transporter ATPase [Thermococcus sibiricus]MCA6214707.1 ABC transporter ATP-binding protein [Thermococcus bergensis]MDK2983194.1 energy-coupling factor transport system ATP-binding protein [Thermococcaceae archaeon]MDN5319897.1 energy-coupling factor transport system ATP-binding protein [Thermococcaceae 
MIEVRNLWHVYEGRKEALKGVSLTFGNEIIALVGPNGSGKTTLAKHLNGLLKPTKGEVIVDGMDTRKYSVAELARVVGYVFQNPEHMFFEENVFKEVAFGPKNLGLSEKEVEERVKWALREVNLEGYEDRSPYSLSGGEKQRLAIACILAMKPKYLILDEPTTGLDEKNAESVKKIIRNLHREGHGILLITHEMDLVLELAERVVLLYQGQKVFDGDVEEFFELDLRKYDLDKPKLLKISEKAGLGFVRDVEEFVKALEMRT